METAESFPEGIRIHIHITSRLVLADGYHSPIVRQIWTLCFGWVDGGPSDQKAAERETRSMAGVINLVASSRAESTW